MLLQFSIVQSRALSSIHVFPRLPLYWNLPRHVARHDKAALTLRPRRRGADRAALQA